MTLGLSLFSGIFVFSLITLILSPIGKKHDSVKNRLDRVSGNIKKDAFAEEGLDKPLFERIFKPFFKTLSQKFVKNSPESGEAIDPKKKSQNEKMKKTLQQAGFSLSVAEYSLIHVSVIFGSAILFLLLGLLLGLGARSVLGLVLGAYAGFVIMRFYISARISGRKRMIERQLPDVLDLLSLSVEAGLGFEQALLHVIEHFDGFIIDELMITHREITMGRTRREALTLFAERCGLNEVKSFTGAVIQAGQMGIPLKNVLRTQAAAMRASRKSKVEEKAMKVSVKILLPMVLFIFPVLFIVLLGPAVVKIINQFKG